MSFTVSSKDCGDGIIARELLLALMLKIAPLLWIKEGLALEKRNQLPITLTEKQKINMA